VPEHHRAVGRFFLEHRHHRPRRFTGIGVILQQAFGLPGQFKPFCGPWGWFGVAFADKRIRNVQLLIQEFSPLVNGTQFQAEVFLDAAGRMKVCMVIGKPRFLPVTGGTSVPGALRLGLDGWFAA